MFDGVRGDSSLGFDDEKINPRVLIGEGLWVEIKLFPFSYTLATIYLDVPPD